MIEKKGILNKKIFDCIKTNHNSIIILKIKLNNNNKKSKNYEIAIVTIVN